MREVPSGTVTFLFTDLEGSTRLWEKNPDAMKVRWPYETIIQYTLTKLDDLRAERNDTS
jgi:hypothetical protein